VSCSDRLLVLLVCAGYITRWSPFQSLYWESHNPYLVRTLTMDFHLLSAYTVECFYLALIHDTMWVSSEFTVSCACFIPLEREMYQNNSSKFNSFLTESTVLLHCRAGWCMLFSEMMSVHCENHMKHTNTRCKQDAGVLNVKAGGTNIWPCF
jgi:hypothetical protein